MSPAERNSRDRGLIRCTTTSTSFGSASTSFGSASTSFGSASAVLRQCFGSASLVNIPPCISMTSIALTTISCLLRTRSQTANSTTTVFCGNPTKADPMFQCGKSQDGTNVEDASLSPYATTELENNRPQANITILHGRVIALQKNWPWK